MANGVEFQSGTLATPPAGTTVDTVQEANGDQRQIICIGSIGSDGQEAQVVTAWLPTQDTTLAAAQSSDAPLFVALTGDPNGDFAGVNLLEQLMDDNSGFGINTRIVNGPMADQNGALIQSDAPAPITLRGGVGALLYVDTTGYQTLHVTTEAMSAQVTASDDFITWTAVNPLSKAGVGNTVTSIAANTGYLIPCAGRWLRFAVTTAGAATAYLRAEPCQVSAVLMTGTGGWVAAAGSNGSLQVGGSVANAVAPNANPNLVAGIDTSGLTRRILVDTGGRLLPATVDSLGTTHPLQSLPPAFSPQNVATLAVAEVGQAEGQSRDEILLQVLRELQILNQQIFTMLTLQNPTAVTALDEPAAYRAEPSIFNQ